MREGVVGAEQLQEAVLLCRAVNKKLGEWAVQMGYMSARQVRIVHAQQRRCDRMFGDLAVRAGFLSADQCEAICVLQREKRLRIGDALLHLHHAHRATLEAAYERFAAAEAGVGGLDEAFADSLTGRAIEPLREQLARLLTRLAFVEMKYDPGMPWSGEVRYDFQALIRIEGDAPIEFGLCFEHRLALHVVCGMLELSPAECDDELVQSGVSELSNMLAGQTQRRVRPDGESRISLPSDGELPATGVAYPLITPEGDGLLVVAL